MSHTIEDLYRRYSRMVFRVCLRYAGNRPEAEDLTQEIFLKLHSLAETFRQESQVGTWIYRISVNACIDFLRTKSRRSGLLLERLDELVLHNLSDHGDSILAKIRLDRILGEIKPETRQILFLVFAEGLDYGAAGEICGMSKAAAAKAVSRLRKKISERQARI